MEVLFNDLKRANAEFEEEVQEAAIRVIKSGWYLRGEESRLFEEEWASYCGQKYCIGCSNGTDAVTLAVMACGLSGRVIRIPANTCWYTVEGLNQADCTALPIDINDKGKLDKPFVTGTMPVPLYGSYPNEVESKCIVFDAAQAAGWKPPIHATVAWSFYPTKNLGAMGDAGGVTSNDPAVADKLRKIKDEFKSSKQVTSRLDEIQAAILRVKLKHLDKQILKRKDIASWYVKHSKVVKPVYGIGESNFHLFVIQVQSRDRLIDYLCKKGIGSKVHYPDTVGKYFSFSETPKAEKWCNEVLSLPCYPGLTEEEVKYVCHHVDEFLCNEM
jgi:dTDP-4-amino-4,6-dideoxygalactose transaminase